jgi:predicted MPP superfamily phosphohydrolase
MAAINRFSCILTLSLVLVTGIFTGCNKQSTAEEERIEYYEINRQNSLRLFTPVMFNSSEGEKKELFKIVHISDAHVSSWSHGNHIQNPYNLKEAVRFANDTSTKINALVATGDHIGNMTSTTHDEAIRFLNNFTNTLYRNNTIPTFTSTGNHDANMLNPNHAVHALSKADLFTHLTSKINYKIHSEGPENYYYADLANPMGGVIRIITLDVTDQNDFIYSSQHNAIISQKQIDWLCHTALKKDMTELHSVIILTHQPMPAEDEALNAIVPNYYLYDWELIPDIIEAFRNKQRFANTYWNKHYIYDYVFVDVSFEDSPGEFICYLGGHLHTYLDFQVKRSGDSPLPNQMMIIANNMSPSEKNATSNIERNNVGLRNNTFNLYAIDTKRKLIHVAFFGATSFYYPQILTLPYL